MLRAIGWTLVMGLIFAAGCASPGNAGLFPGPVRLVGIESVVTPVGIITVGDDVTFSVTISNGREPFSVSWYFGPGMEPQTYESTLDDRTHIANVTAALAGDEPVAFNGHVTVSDYHGNLAQLTFTYTVNPTVD